MQALGMYICGALLQLIGAAAAACLAHQSKRCLQLTPEVQLWYQITFKEVLERQVCQWAVSKWASAHFS
jgi:hypothetical protein